MSSRPGPGEDEGDDDDGRCGRGVHINGATASQSSSSSHNLRMRTTTGGTIGRRRPRREPARSANADEGGVVGGGSRDRGGVRRIHDVSEDRRRLRRRVRLGRTRSVFNGIVAASAVCLACRLAARRRGGSGGGDSPVPAESSPRRPHPRMVITASDSAAATTPIDDVDGPAAVTMIKTGRVLDVEPAPWDPDSSGDYHSTDRREYPPDGCEWMHDWMDSTPTTCNAVHEQRILGFDYNKMLGQGGFRDGWRLRMGTHINRYGGEEDDDDDEVVVLKTLRWNYESHSNWYMERYYEMHRVDAVISDKLAWSPNVIDIHGNCGTSGLYEFAPLGDLEHYIDGHHMDGWERLSIGHQVALAIADFHDPDGHGSAGRGGHSGGGGRPAFAHTDLSMGQFVIDANFRVKLHDFNCARLFSVRSDDHGKLCPVGRGSRSYFGAEKFRSPEELSTGEVTELVDLFSMGNVFYVLLTGMHPYEEVDHETGMDRIRRGIAPRIPSEVRGSGDLVDVALRRAMDMCRTHDPADRSMAKEVALHLGDALAELELRMDGGGDEEGEESSEDGAEGYDGAHASDGLDHTGDDDGADDNDGGRGSLR